MHADFEPVQMRTQTGLGVHITAAGGSRKFLLSPARNPDAPRLWCVRAEICTATGEPDPDQPSVFSNCHLSHTEMVDVFKTIRSETTAWIAAKEQAELRGWLMANTVRSAEEAPKGAIAVSIKENHAT